MKKLRQKFNRFIYNNSSKGIPNLMLLICIGTLVIYFFNMIDQTKLLYRFICFDRSLILKGQIWRLFTYVFVPNSTGIWMFLWLFAYYSIGRMLESSWGTLKFNLFYLSGVLIMDIGALLLGTTANTYYLNLSLFLALATLYPDNRVLFMYIIPLKMKYLAWVYLAFTVFDILSLDFSAVFALINYVLFFGRDVLNVLPGGDRVGSRQFNIHRQQRPNPNWANAYQKKTSSTGTASQSHSTHKKVVDAPSYRHKCTVCGRTDVSNPELDFRYCSKCTGFYCYCQDHINNHAHITQ